MQVFLRKDSDRFVNHMHASSPAHLSACCVQGCPPMALLMMSFHHAGAFVQGRSSVCGPYTFNPSLISLHPWAGISQDDKICRQYAQTYKPKQAAWWVQRVVMNFTDNYSALPHRCSSSGMDHSLWTSYMPPSSSTTYATSMHKTMDQSTGGLVGPKCSHELY